MISYRSHVTRFHVREKPTDAGIPPLTEIVSLLVGVNDVVQGVPEETFRANAARILDALVAEYHRQRGW